MSGQKNNFCFDTEISHILSQKTRHFVSFFCVLLFESCDKAKTSQFFCCEKRPHKRRQTNTMIWIVLLFPFAWKQKRNENNQTKCLFFLSFPLRDLNLSQSTMLAPLKHNKNVPLSKLCFWKSMDINLMFSQTKLVASSLFFIFQLMWCQNLFWEDEAVDTNHNKIGQVLPKVWTQKQNLLEAATSHKNKKKQKRWWNNHKYGMKWTWRFWQPGWELLKILRDWFDEAACSGAWYWSNRN